MIQFAWTEGPEGFKAQMAAQYFIDGIRNLEIQNTLRLVGFKNSTATLVRVLELEAEHSINRSE